MAGHYAVGKLVKKDGTEKQQAGTDAHDPMLTLRPLWVCVPELRRQQITPGSENDQPAGIQKDGDAEDSTDLQAASHEWSVRVRFV